MLLRHLREYKRDDPGPEKKVAILFFVFCLISDRSRETSVGSREKMIAHLFGFFVLLLTDCDLFLWIGDGAREREREREYRFLNNNEPQYANEIFGTIT